jgi:sporulation protein YlmC with PRC-barrel domain
MSQQTVKATTIIGTPVENWDGEHLGLIVEVMINKMHGEVAYLVLSYPDTFGPDYLNKHFAVPFDAIAMKQLTGNVDYILNVNEDFLRKAPGFHKEEYPDFADPKFNSVLKDYYKDVSVDIRV